MIDGGLKRPDLILIDLDGTMVDSVPDLAFCADEMMRQLGLPARGEAAVRDWVGNGIPKLVERALTNDMDAEASPGLLKGAVTLFFEIYADNTSGRSQLYDGVKEGLAELSAAGITLVCVTNKAGRFAQTLLEDMGIAHAFSMLVAGDSLPEKKPHPMPLLHAAAHFGVDPANALMVGDSRSDVKAARAAGFAVACVPYGYNHGIDIRLEQPDVVINSLSELNSLFDESV